MAIENAPTIEELNAGLEGTTKPSLPSLDTLNQGLKKKETPIPTQVETPSPAPLVSEDGTSESEDGGLEQQQPTVSISELQQPIDQQLELPGEIPTPEVGVQEQKIEVPEINLDEEFSQVLSQVQGQTPEERINSKLKVASEITREGETTSARVLSESLQLEVPALQEQMTALSDSQNQINEQLTPIGSRMRDIERIVSDFQAGGIRETEVPTGETEQITLSDGTVTEVPITKKSKTTDRFTPEQIDELINEFNELKAQSQPLVDEFNKNKEDAQNIRQQAVSIQKLPESIWKAENDVLLKDNDALDLFAKSVWNNSIPMLISGTGAIAKSVGTLEGGVQGLPLEIIGESLRDLGEGIKADMPVRFDDKGESINPLDELFKGNFDKKNVAEVTGSVVGPLATIIATGGGASLATGGSVTAVEMSTLAAGTAMGVGEVYDEAKAAGLSDEDAAILSLPAGLVIGLLDKIGGGVVTKKFIAKEMAEKFAKDFVKNSAGKELSIDFVMDTAGKSLTKILRDVPKEGFKGGVQEGITESAQGAVKTVSQFAFDTLTGADNFKLGTFQEELFDILKEGIVGSVPGATFGGLSGIKFQNAVAMQKAMEIKDNPEALLAFNSFLDKEVQLNKMTPERAQEVKDAVSLMGEVNEKIPESIEDFNKRVDAATLIQEKTVVEDSIEGKEESLVQKEKQRIEEINNELQELSGVPVEPTVKTKEDGKTKTKDEAKTVLEKKEPVEEKAEPVKPTEEKVESKPVVEPKPTEEVVAEEEVVQETETIDAPFVDAKRGIKKGDKIEVLKTDNPFLNVLADDLDNLEFLQTKRDEVNSDLQSELSDPTLPQEEIDQISDAVKVLDSLIEPLKEAEPVKVVGKAKIAEGLDELAESFGAKTNIVPNDFNSPNAFNALVKIAEGIVEETGFQGQKLIAELKKRLSDKFGDKVKEDDINEIADEIIESSKKIKKVEAEKAPKEEITEEEVKEGEPTQEKPKAKKGEREKSFLNRALADPSISKKTKKELKGVEKTYKQESNEWNSGQADRLIQSAEKVDGLKELEKDVRSGANNMSGSLQSMLAQKLVRKYQQMAKFKDASDLAIWIDEQARKSGQFNQALDEGTSPEAVVRRKNKNNQINKEKSLDKNGRRKRIKESTDAMSEAAIEVANTIANDPSLSKKVQEVQKSEKVKRSIATTRRIEKRKKRSKEIIDKLEGFKIKGNKLHSALPGVNLLPVTWNGAISVIQASIKAGELMSTAIDKSVQFINDNKTSEEDFNEEAFRDNFKDDVETLDDLKEAASLDILDAVKETIKDHWAKQEAVMAQLAEKFDDLGLSETESKELQDFVLKEFDRQIRETAQVELIKTLGTTKLPRKVNVKTKTDKVVEAYNLGALSDEVYADLFSEEFGFTSLSLEDNKKINDFIEAINLHPEGSESRSRAMKEFNTYLKSLEKDSFKLKFIAETMTEVFYNGILSGFSTIARGAKGVAMSSLGEVFVETVRNPKLVIGTLQGVNALARGLKKGLPRALNIIKDGFIPIESGTEQARGFLEQMVNTPFKDLSIGGKAAKVFEYIIIKSTRTLMAADALAHFTVEEFFALTTAYNKILTDGLKTNEKEFWRALDDEMKTNKSDRIAAEQQANDELNVLKKAGVTTKHFNEKRRVDEILEDQRSEEVKTRAREKADQSRLAHTPVGTLGTFYEIALMAQQRIPLANRIIPFIRIPTNAMDMWLDWSPWGFKRGAVGRGALTRFLLPSFAKKRSESLKFRPPTTDERITHMIKASIGTMVSGIFTAGILAGLDKDDDDPDKWIDSSYRGFGDFSKNTVLRNREDRWQEFSLRIKNPITKEWMGWFSYKDSQFASQFASVSAIADNFRYRKKTEELDEDQASLFAVGLTAGATFIFEQNYFKAISDMGEIFGKDGMNAAAASTVTGDLFAKQVKAAILPNAYKQAYDFYKATTSKPNRFPERYSDNFIKGTFEHIIRDVPMVEDLIKNEAFDQLGYPVVRDLYQTPLVPDFILEGVENVSGTQQDKPEWKLISDKNAFVTFTNVRKYRGIELTTQQRIDLRKKTGEDLRKYINSNMEFLSELNNDSFQKVIDKEKSKITNRNKKVLFLLSTKENK